MVYTNVQLYFAVCQNSEIQLNICAKLVCVKLLYTRTKSKKVWYMDQIENECIIKGSKIHIGEINEGSSSSPGNDTITLIHCDLKRLKHHMST